MTFKDVLEIAAAVLLSLGGGGAIVLGLSSWLGKLWADRIMQKDRQTHELELARLRQSLEQRSSQALEEVRAGLDVAKQKHLKGFHDKLEIYRLASNVITELLAEFDHSALVKQPLQASQFKKFNTERMRAYAYLGMIAPQKVMDAFDDLTDHLILVAHGQVLYVWPDVRAKTMRLINTVREDIGIDVTPMSYNGSL